MPEAAAPARPGFWKSMRADLDSIFARDPAARSRLELLMLYPGVHAVLWHRFAHRLWTHGWCLSARFIAFGSRWLTNIDIHPGAVIGRRFFIDHGAGVVIGETAEIGDDVTLYHGVTLGSTVWKRGKRHPTLGNGVVVGAGAKILGAITLGAGVKVAANSVVIRDVPAGQTVVGIPGRVVQRAGAVGDMLDHHAIPDPVCKALRRLTARIDDLEGQVRRLERERRAAISRTPVADDEPIERRSAGITRETEPWMN